MEYGVTIEKGAVPWQIFQRGADGTAAIRLVGQYKVIRLSPEVPFAFNPVQAGGVKLRARIVWEDSGETLLPWQPCALLEGGRWETEFPAVPAGGLYRIETAMEYEGWDGFSVTRGDMVHHVGVGDIYLVAGQSNACGRSKAPIVDAPELGVHLLRNSGRWDLASHPLGETTGAVHTGHFENHNPGHSPWLHFGKCLKRALGVPVGIMMTCHGGTPLKWWNPAENGALFRNMVEMAQANGVRPRAMLWYQGEAECYEDGSKDYLERFSNFVTETRKSLGDAGLPVFTVQLNRCLNDITDELDRHWGRVREAQRIAPQKLANVYVVPANDLSLYDTAHISSQGNLRLGERVANVVLAELFGRDNCWRAPEPQRAELLAPDTVRLTLAPVYNALDVYGLPAAVLPFEAEDAEGLLRVKEYTLEREALLLTFSRPLGQGAVLHGAWRMAPGPAIPQDLARSPMLSFYAFPITAANTKEETR